MLIISNSFPRDFKVSLILTKNKLNGLIKARTFVGQHFVVFVFERLCYDLMEFVLYALYLGYS